MGNYCYPSHEVDLGSSIKKPSFKRIKSESDLFESSNTLNKKKSFQIDEIQTINLIGEIQIHQFLQEAKFAIELDPIRNIKFRLVNEKFKLMGNEYSFYADFSDLPSGNKLHRYSHQLEYPFTPAMYFLLTSRRKK